MKEYLKKLARPVLASYIRNDFFHFGNELTVLMYHRVLPEGEASSETVQPGMAVTIDTFKKHLHWLQDKYELVHLGDWCDKAKAGLPVPPRACAITFDDGWYDNYQYAFPILKELNVPITVFLPAGIIENRTRFWPERLADFLWNSGRGIDSSQFNDDDLRWLTTLGGSYEFYGAVPSRSHIDELIGMAKSYEDSFIHDKLDKLLAITKPGSYESNVDELVDWEHARLMCESGLVEYGSHGMNHVRLGEVMRKGDLEEEVVSSKALIEKRMQVEINLFSYPNGDYCRQSKALVDSVYKGVCITKRGVNKSNGDIKMLKRISMHEAVTSNETDFFCRLSGVM